MKRLLLALLGSTPCVAQGPSSPNVVIIYTDDQGYGDCSALNAEAKFETPNLDRLAKGGMVFTDGHSADTICTPSRYALLTGRYAWRTRLKRGVLGADTPCLIAPNRVTIGSLLQSAGYRTAFVGKWHLGMDIPGTKGNRDWSAQVPDGPLSRGFDEFFGIPASMNFGVLTWYEGATATAPATMWTRKKFPDAEITTKPLDYRMAPPFEASPRGRADIEVAADFRDEDVLARITARAVRIIENAAEDQPAGQTSSRPFFVFVSFTSPHLPHCTAPAFRGKSSMGNYGDFMTETDARVGQILDAIESTGTADNTLVIFTSDNGPENNYRDWERIYGHRSNGGFRGGKRDVWEGGHRVPFIVRWPGVVTPGSRHDGPVCQVDVLRTLSDIVERPLPDDTGEDSESFFAALRGHQTSRTAPLIHHSGSGHFAIRDGRFKLVMFRTQASGRQPDERSVELYDLVNDPRESGDVAERFPRTVTRLTALLTDVVLQGRSTPGQPQQNDGDAWWPRLTWLPQPSSKR